MVLPREKGGGEEIVRTTAVRTRDTGQELQNTYCRTRTIGHVL